MKQIIPSEYEEQCALVEYLEMKGLMFSAIAQDTFTQNWSVKIRNKKRGVRSGLPDILVFIPKKNILLFIELKRIKSSPSQTKKSQTEWIENLNKVEGVLALVAKGAGEAIDFIEESLK